LLTRPIENTNKCINAHLKSDSKYFRRAPFPHHRNWHEIMSASLTEEEEEYIRRQEREDEMESDDDNFNLKDNVDLAFEESGEEEEEGGSSNEKDGV
jgi:hypothetical protein